MLANPRIRACIVTAALATAAMASQGCTDQPFTVDVPLRVVSTEPSAGATQIARDQVLTVRFSEELDDASVDADSFLLEDGDGSPVEVEVAYEGGESHVVSITPESLLSYSAEYRLVITTDVKRQRDGGPLPVTVSSTFSTEDPPVLRLTDSSPGNGSVGVSRDAPISLTFSEPPNCEELQAEASIVEMRDPHPRLEGEESFEIAGTWHCPEPTFDPEGPSQEIDCDGEPSPCKATFTPAEEDFLFGWSSEVTITLPKGIGSTRATETAGRLPETATVSFQVEHPPPMYVTGTSPAAGAEGVPLDGEVVLVFSEGVYCNSFTDEKISVIEHLNSHPTYGGGTFEHSFAIDCTTGQSAVTLVMDTNFLYSSEVVVSLSGGAFDGALESSRATTLGGQLPEDVDFTFRAADPPSLAITSSYPSNGAETIDLNALIEVTFSEPVNCESLDAVSLVEQLDDHENYGGESLVHELTVHCEGDSPTVELTPHETFQHSSLVTLTLPGGIYPDAVESRRATTRAGQLPGDVELSFRTIDPPALLVTGASPSPGAVRVATDSNVSVTFSEPVDCDSLNDQTFSLAELTDDGSVIAHTCSFSCQGSTATCEPADSFGLTSTVTVSLTTGIESERASSRGGWLSSDFSYEFDISDPPPLLVASTQPGDGNTNVCPDTLVTVVFNEPVDCETIDDTTFVIEARDPDSGDSFEPVTGSYACGHGSSTVTFDAHPRYEYDYEVRVTLTKDIASARATSAGGNLAQEIQLTFRIIPVPPLEVTSTVPAHEQQSVPLGAGIEVVFNQDVLVSTLCTEPDDDVCPQPNVWIVEEGEAIDERLPLSLVTYDPDSFTAVFQPEVELEIASRYEVNVRGGITGVRTQQGAILLATYRWHFDTGVTDLVARTNPRNEETDVPVSTDICAVFTRDLDTDTFFVTFEDDFGRTIKVSTDELIIDGVDPATGESSDLFDANRVCLVPDPTIYGCMPKQQSLLYNTEYTATLASGIEFETNEVLDLDYTWIFTTGDPPQIAGVSARNFLVEVDPLRDGEDVPVNVTVTISFSEAMEEGSIDETTVYLIDSEETAVPAQVSYDANAMEAELVPDSLLEFDSEYRLVLASGMLGIVTEEEEWLERDYELSFATSKAVAARISFPQGESAYEASVIAATFSRDMHFPSLNSETFHAYDHSRDALMTGIVALNTDDPRAAVLVAVPTFEEGNEVEVTIATAAHDERGNPLPHDISVVYPSIQRAPALSSRIPGTIGAGNLSPNAGTVLGDQEFTLTLPHPGAQLQNRMMPPSFNEQTIVITDVDGCNGPAGGVLGMRKDYQIGEAGQPDAVAFQAGASLMSGCDYEIRLVQSEFTNLFTASHTGGDVVVTVTGESDPPEITEVSPDPALPLDADAGITITFNENIDPASVTPQTVGLTNFDGALVDAAISVDGSSIYLEPRSPLPSAGNPYELEVGEVTDMAGNAFGGDTFSYEVDDVPPVVEDVDPPAVMGDPFVIVFSKAVAPSTIVGDTDLADGSIRLLDQEAGSVLGCLSVDGETVLFEPVEEMTTGQSYTLLVTTEVEDLAGNAKSQDYEETFEAP